MPWFIQLIMAIFMIILYIAIFMGMYTSSSYLDKRILYSFGIGTYSTLLLLFWILQYSIHIQSSIGELQNYLNNSKTI